ncbi:MAG: hypothetical protein A2X94_12125 [Bdellovibrionales bacterium GWB1_55_8]|nr:MAG: hypothetical protein A2X94_12125 [Bdellovibrionales bacterium GWB1_55_8]
MEQIVIPLVAFAASLLTFFSGFGLGTLLMPVFAIFFPVDLAVGMTAVVHFLNGLFKVGLVGRHAVKRVVVRFGAPAVLGAVIGAWFLTQISDADPILTYRLGEREFRVFPVKFVVAALIVVFTLFELLPKLRNMEISSRYLSLGGILSGFFGGLSGHQGALRSAFLARAGLSKEQFVATGAMIATFIDVARIGVYSTHFAADGFSANSRLLILTTAAAFAGAFAGNRVLQKVTMRGIQVFVSFSLLVLSMALGAGLI